MGPPFVVVDEISIQGRPLHRTPRRRRRGALGGQCRRFLRQRPRRDDQRAVQSRGDPSARTLAVLGSRRVCDPRMGRLVQQPPAPRADRQHSAGRGRATLVGRTGAGGHRRLTQRAELPTNPARFREPSASANWESTTRKLVAERQQSGKE